MPNKAINGKLFTPQRFGWLGHYTLKHHSVDISHYGGVIFKGKCE